MHVTLTCIIAVFIMAVELTEPDRFGQRHPLETPELIQTKLAELELELKDLPLEQKEAFEQAIVECPDQAVNVEFRLWFLRCEVFRPRVRLASVFACEMNVVFL